MAKLIVNTANMPLSEWLELRKQGIGGSDAAAVAGVSKYANPVTLYMEKLGFYEKNSKDNVREAAEWGNRLEPVIRETFKEKINAEREEQGLPPLRIVHRKAIFAHDEHDFMRTNLDGQIFGHELGTGILEIKTAHYMLREDWDGIDVPNAYFIQVQHNMMVMDAKFAYLAVLIGGNTYKHYFIQRDEDICNYLVQIESHFWNNHILQRVVPELTGHKFEKEMMDELHGNTIQREDEIVTLPNIVIEYAERIEALKQLQEELKQEQTKYENEIKLIMGETELGFAGPHKISWKTDKRGNRSFRIRLDSSNDKEKYYLAKLKEIEKEKKVFEKNTKELAKMKLSLEKAATKERKEREKREKLALKEAQKQLALAEQELQSIQKIV